MSIDFEAKHARSDQSDPSRRNGAFTTMSRPGGSVGGLGDGTCVVCGEVNEDGMCTACTATVCERCLAPLDDAGHGQVCSDCADSDTGDEDDDFDDDDLRYEEQVGDSYRSNVESRLDADLARDAGIDPRRVAAAWVDGNHTSDGLTLWEAVAESHPHLVAPERTDGHRMPQGTVTGGSAALATPADPLGLGYDAEFVEGTQVTYHERLSLNLAALGWMHADGSRRTVGEAQRLSSGNLAITNLQDRAAQMTPTERATLAATWSHLQEGLPSERLDAVREGVEERTARHGRDEIVDRQMERIDADHGGTTARSALRDAAWALAHYHQIDNDDLVETTPDGRRIGWTRQTYERMVEPVERVFGRIAS